MNDEANAVRMFTAEGCLHCYSRDPFLLSPGDLLKADSDPEMREVMEGSNIYVVVCRRRILISPESSFDGTTLTGQLVVMRDKGWTGVPFSFELPPNLGFTPQSARASVLPSGTHIELIDDIAGKKYLLGACQIASGAITPLTEDERDLHVLYVGQSQGRKKARIALDRLRNHHTFQAILADFHTFHPEMELLLLLYQFGSSQKFISNAGDFSLDPLATPDEDRAHLERIMNAQVLRRDRVSLVEAALINYFKPHYNIVFKQTDFRSDAKKLKTLRAVLNTGLTGLTIEIGTANINSRLYSEAQLSDNSAYETALELRDAHVANPRGQPSENAEVFEFVHRMARTHIAKFALTTESERETFMHGTKWHGAEERVPFI
ncbi:hypothetical protein [Lysobacter sp. CA199]|uniref:hypothetical protein n=1 Tax=Lysobacter sp. CA199 TaxID=3455608 RepID=UPI003F8D0D11